MAKVRSSSNVLHLRNVQFTIEMYIEVFKPQKLCKQRRDFENRIMHSCKIKKNISKVIYLTVKYRLGELRGMLQAGCFLF